MTHLSSITVCALLASALVAPHASAQWNMGSLDGSAERNRVYTTFGLDPAFVGSVGYARVIPVMNHGFQLTTEAGVATSGMDMRDYRARLGAQTSLMHWRSVHLTGSATFITRGTENSIYRAFNFGADLTGAVGVYRRRWFAAGEFGKDKAIITHVTNSDWYRKNFYADAKDGWYLDAGGTYHYGVAGGIVVGRAELAARAGWSRTEKFHDVMPPLYVSAGLGIGF